MNTEKITARINELTEMAYHNGIATMTDEIDCIIHPAQPTNIPKTKRAIMRGIASVLLDDSVEWDVFETADGQCHLIIISTN